MKVHVVWDVSNFTSVNSNLIGKHARCWDFDRISPVVVVVAERISEIQNSVLGNLGSVGGDVEVSWFDGSLSNRVWHKEEIEDTINNFRLLNEPLVNIRSLRWVSNRLISAHLEESLPDSFVHNDEGVLGENWFFVVFESVFLQNNFVQLLQLVSNNL
jgi:hypothetical protein